MTKKDCFIVPYNDEHENPVRTLLDEHELELPNDELPPIGCLAVVDDNGVATIAGYIGGCLTYGFNSFVEVLAVDDQYKSLGIGLRLASTMARMLLDRGAKTVQWFIEGKSDYLGWHKLILGKETSDSLEPMYVPGIDLDSLYNRLQGVINDRQ